MERFSQWRRDTKADDLNDYMLSSGDGINDELSKYDSRYNRLQCGWEALPTAWFDDYILAGQGRESVRENPNWTFDRTDLGAFRFRISNLDSGLIIQLSSTYTDAFGFWIVVDPPEYPGSIYLAKPALGRQPLPNTMLPVSGVKLNFAQPTDFWVVYANGRIMLGLGLQPEANIIYDVNVSYAYPGMQQFSFGKLCLDDAFAKITNVVNFRRLFPRQ